MTAPSGPRGPASGPDTTLLVIAKQPLPGRVKTRLVPPCTAQQAATLAEAALADTLHAVLAAPARRRVLVLEGEPGPWLPPGFDIMRARLLQAGLRVAELPQLRDVDTAADARAVALQVPRSRFAARAREYLPFLGSAGAARPVGAAREQP